MHNKRHKKVPRKRSVTARNPRITINNFKSRENICPPTDKYIGNHIIFSKYIKKLTCDIKPYYNGDMKKILLGFLLVSILVMTGCGVKSDLQRSDNFPRNYPVY